MRIGVETTVSLLCKSGESLNTHAVLCLLHVRKVKQKSISIHPLGMYSCHRERLPGFPQQSQAYVCVGKSVWGESEDKSANMYALSVSPALVDKATHRASVNSKAVVGREGSLSQPMWKQPSPMATPLTESSSL
jgi:hypothetical protein